jgi:penicillin-binding protein 2
MRDVVTGNSVVDRYIPGDLRDANGNLVAVGGKTGTAQNSSGCDNALFICAAPFDNPEIVISVVIEQGYTGGYASFTAGRILEAFYNTND